MCRLYGKFASYLRRVLCKTRLIFRRINGPNDDDDDGFDVDDYGKNEVEGEEDNDNHHHHHHTKLYFI